MTFLVVSPDTVAMESCTYASMQVLVALHIARAQHLLLNREAHLHAIHAGVQQQREVFYILCASQG